MDDQKVRARRDPARRRQAIVEAAAALIVEDGVAELTHRRAAERAGVPLGATTYYFSSLEELSDAALAHLVDYVEADLREVAEALAHGPVGPERLASLLHAYLSDRARLQADAALYEAAIRRRTLRPLALHWFDGLVKVLSNGVGPDAARALAVFADGLVVHALLHDEPMDLAPLTAAVTALLHIDPETRPRASVVPEGGGRS
jgi:TetR/AcrR family transcriptional regulator, regulator of biofilm formation and stress response